MPKDQSAKLATLVSHKGRAVVAHTVNPSTRETEADGHPELQEIDPVKRETAHTKVIPALGMTHL